MPALTDALVCCGGSIPGLGARGPSPYAFADAGPMTITMLLMNTLEAAERCRP
ncbi:MAG: hypothetical protein KGJ44_06810 [Betaproteobacteria bacterium]|nr:hypothetical protein [Betaproteobacteria bacterium]